MLYYKIVLTNIMYDWYKDYKSCCWHIADIQYQQYLSKLCIRVKKRRNDLCYLWLHVIDSVRSPESKHNHIMIKFIVFRFTRWWFRSVAIVVRHAMIMRQNFLESIEGCTVESITFVMLNVCYIGGRYVLPKHSKAPCTVILTLLAILVEILLFIRRCQDDENPLLWIIGVFWVLLMASRQVFSV